MELNPSWEGSSRLASQEISWICLTGCSIPALIRVRSLTLSWKRPQHYTLFLEKSIWIFSFRLYHYLPTIFWNVFMKMEFEIKFSHVQMLLNAVNPYNPVVTTYI
jgi:hypothetical protein